MLLDCTPGLTTLDAGETGDAYAEGELAVLFRAIGTLTCLHSLGLANFQGQTTWRSSTSTALADGLRGLTQLVELDIQGNDFGTEDAFARVLEQRLTGLTTLKLLGLGKNVEQCSYAAADWGELVLGTLGGMTALRCLHMDNKGEWAPHVTTALAGALRSLTHLKELHMLDNIFCAEGATALAGGLQHLSQLKELKMGMNSYRQHHSFPEAATRYRLQRLGVFSAEAIAESVVALATPLSSLTSLTTLAPYQWQRDGLFVGPCHSETVHTFAAEIARLSRFAYLKNRNCPQTLTDLNVGESELDFSEASTLADAMKGLTGLTRLNLLDKNRSHRVALELGVALLHLTGLRVLSLENSVVWPMGLKSLAPMVAQMTNLTGLHIGSAGNGPRRESEIDLDFKVTCLQLESRQDADVESEMQYLDVHMQGVQHCVRAHTRARACAYECCARDRACILQAY